MNPSQRPSFSSGQGQPHSFVRAQLAQTGMPLSRPPQQQRSTQPNDYSNSSNNMMPQLQTRTLSTGLQNATVQQAPNAS